MRLKTRPKSKIISVEIQTPTGTRTVSTGTTDPAEAKALVKAAKIETIESLAKVGELTQALIQKLTIAGSMTVSKAIEEWSEWILATAGSDRTAHNHIMFVNAWAREMKTANRKLCTVTTTDVSKWVNADDGTTFATRKVRLASVRSMFRFCSIRNYLNPNPSQEVRIKAKNLTHEQKEPRKKKCFTAEEFKRLTDYLSERIVELMGSKDQTAYVDRRLDWARFWYCASYIGRYSGLRLGDVCTLEWSSLKTKPGHLVVWTDKRDTRVDIPIGEDLARGISFIQPSGKAFCFPHQNEISRDPQKRAILSVSFSRILEACGIEDHSFHDLRHSLASELNAKGETLAAIAEALGHTSQASTKVYIH